MQSKEYRIDLRNLGPIVDEEIIVSPGVTVCTGTNGVGKSTAINAIAMLAGRDVSIPVRDGAKQGLVEGLGILISITASKMLPMGECEFESIEERADLATLVDPGVKGADVAFRRRVKCILSLTETRVELADFARVLPEALREKLSPADACDDACDMAAKVKRRMEALAREAWEAATKAGAEASAEDKLIDGVEMPQSPDEVDEARLNERLQYWTIENARILERAKNAKESAEASAQARASLAAASTSVAVSRRMFEVESAEADHAFGEAAERNQRAAENVARLKAELESAKAEQLAADEAHRVAGERVKALHERKLALIESERRLAELQEAAAAKIAAPPSEDDVEAYAEKVKQAQEAVAWGRRVREAKAAYERRYEKRKVQQAAIERSEVFRAAAKATDSVLTDAVNCKFLQVMNGDLYFVDREAVGEPEQFSRLSDGERWRVAIVEVAHALGRSGKPAILPLPQVAWEGLGTASRKLVAETAAGCNLSIVTAEVSDDERFGYYRFDPSQVS